MAKAVLRDRAVLTALMAEAILPWLVEVVGHLVGVLDGLPVQVPEAQFVLSGPVQLDNSHLQTQMM
jgi:hypothetical protein